MDNGHITTLKALLEHVVLRWAKNKQTVMYDEQVQMIKQKDQ